MYCRYNELVQHRKKWGAAKKPDADPLGGGSSTGGRGRGTATTGGYTGKTAGTTPQSDHFAGDHGGHGSAWPKPSTPHYGGAQGHLNAMFDSQDRNFKFTGRGFRAPTKGNADPFSALNRATPQHYSRTESRVRTVLVGGFLVFAGLTLLTASTARMPWQQSTLNSRWDKHPMWHGRHNSGAKPTAATATPVRGDTGAKATAAAEARKLKAEGDQAKLRGDFAAANVAYTTANRLVA